MSVLEEMRKQVETEEAETVEVAPAEDEAPTLEVEEPEQDETEGEEPEVTESDDSDEVDEIDLTLDDESEKPSKPTPEQALLYKLTKAKKKAKTAEERLAELEQENEQLRNGQAPQPAPTAQPVQQNSMAAQYGYPPIPVMYENGINTAAEYQAAYANWSTECRRIDQAKADQERQASSNEKANQERALKLAERATTFIKSNRIKQDLATDKIQAGIQSLDEILKVDGIALELLDNIGEGSEKVAYFLGDNARALATIKELYKEDPRGFKVTAWLTNTANKLNRKNTQHISKAPEPDEALEGNGSSASATKLQAEYDKESDFDKLRKIRAKAKELGITLK